jgi:predicted AAA+ superfamily ATPase
MGEIRQRYRLLDKILPNANQKRLVVLTGARQTGKTTLSKKKYPQLKYINLDAPENREILTHLPTTSWGNVVHHAVLDEAQKAPVVFEKVKYAFDEGEILFSVLTGSSQILLLKKIRESLAGRAFFYELWPLMQCEINFCSDSVHMAQPLLKRLLDTGSLESVFSKTPLALLDKADAKYVRAENHILKWGGMPALLSLNETDKWKWLKDYGYTYLERDLADLAQLNDLSPFRKFQKLTALRSGMLLNYSELARDTGISVDTARRYLEYLRVSYQTFLIQPFHKNLTSSVVKTPKIYWTDIGILRQLTGFRGTLTGEIYETMVVSELVKWTRTCQMDLEVYFYRTRSGMELDLLIETESGFLGIEIKSRPRIFKKDARVIKEIGSKLGSKWIGGIVIYRGNEIRPIDEPNIWAVPSRRLFQAPDPEF